MILKIWVSFSQKNSKIGKIYTNLNSPYFSQMFANILSWKKSGNLEK
jgi:hypothetical protein